MYKTENFLPEVIKQVNNRGYTDVIPMSVFKIEVMRQTGINQDKTFGNLVRKLEMLGYVRSNPSKSTLELCSDIEDPYVFNSDKKGEE